MNKLGQSFLLLLVGSALSLMTHCREASNAPSNELLYTLPYKPLTDSIKRNPKQPDLYLSRALLLSQHNNHELATADYRKAWELRPDEASGLEYSANLMLVNDTVAVLALLHECKQRFPDNSEFNRRLSEILVETGNGAAALAEYEVLLQKDSLNFNAWYEKGLLQLRLKDTAAALQALQRSYQLYPSTFAGLSLANLYASLQDSRVLTICNNLIQKDSSASMIDALFLKGVYYSDQKQYGNALNAFEACIRKDWKFIDAYIEKGIVFFEQKRYAQALKTFETATQVSNTNADAYYWMGRCEESLHADSSALENYQRSLYFDAQLTEARVRMESLLLKYKGGK